jgi:hypothetical protein
MAIKDDKLSFNKTNCHIQIQTRGNGGFPVLDSCRYQSGQAEVPAQARQGLIGADPEKV